MFIDSLSSLIQDIAGISAPAAAVSVGVAAVQLPDAAPKVSPNGDPSPEPLTVPLKEEVKQEFKQETEVRYFNTPSEVKPEECLESANIVIYRSVACSGELSFGSGRGP